MMVSVVHFCKMDVEQEKNWQSISR